MIAWLMLALVVAAIALRWRGRSLAALVAAWLRGPGASRSRGTAASAAAIIMIYGMTSLVALAAAGRLDAIVTFPAELHDATAWVAPIGAGDLWVFAAGIGGGAVLGALLVALTAWRGWRQFGPAYRSPAIARGAHEIGAALVLSAAAGLAEELCFRLAIPLLVAIVSGSGVVGCGVGWALFALAHRYQGRGAMAAVALVGTALAWAYLATGLLLVVVVLHALVDVNALVVRPWMERRFALRVPAHGGTPTHKRNPGGG